MPVGDWDAAEQADEEQYWLDREAAREEMLEEVNEVLRPYRLKVTEAHYKLVVTEIQ